MFESYTLGTISDLYVGYFSNLRTQEGIRELIFKVMRINGNWASLRSGCGIAILKRIRPIRAPEASVGRGRIVFSSSGTQNRSPETRVKRESRLVSCLVSGASGVAAALFATLFPSDCEICHQPLLNISRLPVCDDCLSAMRPIAGGLCSVCGERLSGPYALAVAPGELLCGLCRRSQPPFIKATAYGSYDGGLRELIHLLKYDQIRPAANVLGRMLAEAIEDLPLAEPDSWLVVPVPLYTRKLRQRGFNQAEMIARAALKLVGERERFQLAAEVLVRRRETQSQIGLSRHQRRENMRGAFSVSRPEEFAGREILLVDDVFTTGTTVSECARVLRRAGASKVYVATVARTLKVEAEGIKIAAEPEESRMAMAAAGS